MVRISSNAFASSGLLAIAIPSSVTFLEVEFILDKKFALLVINHIVFLNLRERFLLPLLWGTSFYRRRWLLFKRIHFSVARIWLQLSSQRKIFVADSRSISIIIDIPLCCRSVVVIGAYSFSRSGLRLIMVPTSVNTIGMVSSFFPFKSVLKVLWGECIVLECFRIWRRPEECVSANLADFYKCEFLPVLREAIHNQLSDVRIITILTFPFQFLFFVVFRRSLVSIYSRAFTLTGLVNVTVPSSVVFIDVVMR